LVQTVFDFVPQGRGSERLLDPLGHDGAL
jgi:hypothetical protein